MPRKASPKMERSTMSAVGRIEKENCPTDLTTQRLEENLVRVSVMCRLPILIGCGRFENYT